MKRLAIFGFGLIGASVAKALREAAPSIECIAMDLPSVISSLDVRSLSVEQVDSSDRDALQRAAETVDLVLMAAPVGVITRELPALLEAASALTDCGSTKRSICEAASALPSSRRFVPGHPMAGGPEGGAALARDDLFQGQTWLICPEHSDPEPVARVEQLISLVGARAVAISAADHDRAVAYTSHAPQILASTLAMLAARSGSLPAAGPAFRATTRSAGGAEVMWRDIFSANADEIAAALRAVSAELELVARGLEQSPADPSNALELLAKARSARAR
jgi:prephenate dehydrogenase